MRLTKLLAVLLALGLVAAACGDDGDDTTATTAGGTTTTADDGSTATTADAMVDPATDFGVNDKTIRIGLNADLSGPFSSLVTEIVLAQEVYWDKINEEGGIEGYMVETVVLDSGYATDKGIENYQALADESADGVLMISENTGSPITAAIAEDAVDDNMLVIPLSWASLWPAPEYVNILEKNTTYCAESMNGVSWLKDHVEEKGLEAKLAIVSQPGEYGADGAAGAELAASALGIEVVYNGKDQIAGDDLTAVTSQLVNSGATMVWTTTTPGRLADIFGGAVSQGFEADWSGNSPSFSYPALLPTALAPAFDQYYWQSGYYVPWNGDNSPGMQEMVAEITARQPSATLSDSYVTGWIEGIMVETIIRQAIADGDLTRAGVVAASQKVSFDFMGLAPNQSYTGDYNTDVVRDSYIYDIDATAFDLQPVSAGTGSSGLSIVEGPFVSDVLANYVFDGPCI